MLLLVNKVYFSPLSAELFCVWGKEGNHSSLGLRSLQTTTLICLPGTTFSRIFPHSISGPLILWDIFYFKGLCYPEFLLGMRDSVPCSFLRQAVFLWIVQEPK